jgi:hypothetical protein
VSHSSFSLTPPSGQFLFDCFRFQVQQVNITSLPQRYFLFALFQVCYFSPMPNKQASLQICPAVFQVFWFIAVPLCQIGEIGFGCRRGSVPNWKQTSVCNTFI